MSRVQGSRRALAATAAAVACYPLLPAGTVREAGYDALAALCLVVAFAGLLRNRSEGDRGWLLVLLGYTGWVVGDIQNSLELQTFHLTSYPLPSDVVYLCSYGVLASGLVVIVRGRRRDADPGALLDALIVTVGVGVVAAVFVIGPIAEDSSLSVLGKAVGSSYPLADVLLLGILVRLWAGRGRRTLSFRLLLGSLVATLLGDTCWNVQLLVTGSSDSATWNDMLWLASYVLVAAAVSDPSMRTLCEPGLEPADQIGPRRRLAVLGGGLLLPGLALVGDGLLQRGVSWPVLGVGSVLLSSLIVLRLATLVGVVQVQAVQLAALAGSDTLTGAPNRRTWDHQLSLACKRSLDEGSPLVVAMLDLDHFKYFNDRHGHQAGDLLLREAVAAWSDLLAPGELIARYGGEEFALLLPGVSVAEACARLAALREVTPGRQTFSAGVAVWDPVTKPAVAVGAADRALYDAKHDGRDRVRVADAGPARTSLPSLSVALQPIVELYDGKVVAVEALSRFAGQDPQSAFAEAYRTGVGPDLEAAAIRAALDCRPATGLVSINVSSEAIATRVVQDALPADLSGVMVEITETSDIERWEELSRVVDTLRRRGAIIAVDDWGQGYSNLDRLLRLRPEVVKLDMSLTRALDSDMHVAMVRSITAWAQSLGISVCAEGIETAQQWATLQQLGVHLGQGYLFGRPLPPEQAVVPEASSTISRMG